MALMAYEQMEVTQAVYQEPVETYLFVDDVPLFAQERQIFRTAATQLLESKRMQQGESKGVYYAPIDALSTADKVVAAEASYGQDSPQHTALFGALVQDCSRLYLEWKRKLSSEWHKPLHHRHDAETNGYYSDGLLIRRLTESGIVPMTNDREGEQRRINEHVEEQTPGMLRMLGGVALSGKKVMTISECSDKAVSEYRADMSAGRPHQGYHGYVPEIEKLMLREFSPDAETYDRYETQVALPGTYVTSDIIKLALQRRGLDMDDMTKTERQGAQFLSDGGLDDLVPLLDEVASEQWCVPIFMGEVVDESHAKDYAAFRREANTRDEESFAVATVIAAFTLELAADPTTDRHKAPAKVETFVKMLLLDEAKQDITAAKVMFDEATAEGLHQVAILEREGRHEEAALLMDKVERAAPGGGYCGAGSCGIEAVKLTGSDLDKLKKDIGFENGDKLVKHPEMKCPKCGPNGDVHYAYRKTGKVKKLCNKCGTKDI